MTPFGWLTTRDLTELPSIHKVEKGIKLNSATIFLQHFQRSAAT